MCISIYVSVWSGAVIRKGYVVVVYGLSLFDDKEDELGEL